jgi:chromosome segregation ATPase
VKKEISKQRSSIFAISIALLLASLNSNAAFAADPADKLAAIAEGTMANDRQKTTQNKATTAKTHGGFLAPVKRLHEEVAKLELRLAKLNVPLDKVAAIAEGTMANDQQNTTEDKEAKAKTGGGFLAPITRLQDEVVKLELRLAKLNVPLDKLEPGTIALSNDMIAIKAQTAELLHQIDHTDLEMKTLRSEITTLRQPIVDLRGPVMLLKDPVTHLKDPVHLLHEPLENVVGEVAQIQLPLKSVSSGLSSLSGRFTELDSRFTELDSRFLELDRRFATLDGRFATLGLQLAGLESVLFWLLIAIVSAASIAVILSTILGILHWRRGKQANHN